MINERNADAIFYFGIQIYDSFKDGFDMQQWSHIRAMWVHLKFKVPRIWAKTSRKNAIVLIVHRCFIQLPDVILLFAVAFFARLLLLLSDFFVAAIISCIKTKLAI